jgi:Rrf2 family protein
MKINAKMHYGLKAMIELALNSGDKGLLQKEIAEKQNVPPRFMEAIIHDLKVAGFIMNGPNRKTGYKLLQDPQKISVYDIYRAFSPDINIHFCLAGDYNCPRSNDCASHCLYYDLNFKIQSYLKSVTLSDLMTKQKELDSSIENLSPVTLN